MATAPPAGIPRRNTIWDLIGRDQDSQLEPQHPAQPHAKA
jgi:hypothetical protein